MSTSIGSWEGRHLVWVDKLLLGFFGAVRPIQLILNIHSVGKGQGSHSHFQVTEIEVSGAVTTVEI